MEFIIGRKVEGNSAVKIDNQYVSAKHCRIWKDEQSGGYYIEDLDSTNGTYVNGVDVKRMVIQPTDEIMLGGANGYKITLEQLLAGDNVSCAHSNDGHNLQHLAKIYEEHHKQRNKLKSRMQLFSTMRFVVPTIVSALAVYFVQGAQEVMGIVTVALVVVSIIVSSRLVRKTEAKINELVTQFQMDYSCPNSKRFYGDKSWKVLQQEATCIFCKEKFTE